jgi:hypothetical protein
MSIRIYFIYSWSLSSSTPSTVSSSTSSFYVLSSCHLYCQWSHRPLFHQTRRRTTCSSPPCPRCSSRWWAGCTPSCMRMFSVLSIWKPYRSNWPPTRTFPWESEESENTQNEWFIHHIILDRGGSRTCYWGCQRGVFCFMISLEPPAFLYIEIFQYSGITSASSTDHYFPLFLILVNTIFSFFIFVFLFLPTESIFYFPVL